MRPPELWDEWRNSLEAAEQKDLSGCFARHCRLVLLVLSAGERRSGAIATAIECDPADVSAGLSLLRDAGLVTFRKVGKERRYSLGPRATVNVEADRVTIRLSKPNGESISHSYIKTRGPRAQPGADASSGGAVRRTPAGPSGIGRDAGAPTAAPGRPPGRVDGELTDGRVQDPSPKARARSAPRPASGHEPA